MSDHVWYKCEHLSTERTNVFFCETCDSQVNTQCEDVYDEPDWWDPDKKRQVERECDLEQARIVHGS